MASGVFPCARPVAHGVRGVHAGLPFPIGGLGPSRGPNLYTGQPWALIAGVTETPTHLVFDGTQIDGSLAVRITGLPLAEGDRVFLAYEVESRTTGTVSFNASLNAVPDETVLAANGRVEETVTVGSSQSDRVMFIGGGSFDGSIRLDSIEVRRVA